MLADDDRSQRLLFVFPSITIAAVYKLKFSFFFTGISKMQIPFKSKSKLAKSRHSEARDHEKEQHAWPYLSINVWA